MADDNDELLNKADALMRRRRIFLAGANDADGAHELAAAAAAEEDVPLLTEVVGPEAFAEAAAWSTIDVAALRRALAEELEAWLDTRLPAHVQRVLDGITDQLILQLSDKARGELLPRLLELLATAQQGAEARPADE
ncbi:MAG: hypothetical protein ACM3Y9_08790 [Ignavibacteria bacterium]